MKTLCINCEQSELVRATVKLSGEIRKHPYTIEMEGWQCPNCGYSTVDSKAMTELGRRAADVYRRANELLTSDEIVALRGKESQEAFAKRIGVGVASIKRWELGKIQDRVYDNLLREKTKPKVDYARTYITAGASSTGCSGFTLRLGIVRLDASVILVGDISTTARNWGLSQGTRKSEQNIIAAKMGVSQTCIVGRTRATTDIPIVDPIIIRGNYARR